MAEEEKKMCACCGYTKGPGFPREREGVILIFCARCNNFECDSGPDQKIVISGITHRYQGNHFLVCIAISRK